MKPSLIVSALETLILVKQPVFLWGPPGVGKSRVVSQVADRLGMELIDVRAVLLDPVDLRGLPHINGDGQAHWCPPEFLPSSGQGILFLDELNAATPLVQAACYQLILDRRIGEYRLPQGWTIIAAGNRESDRAVTHRMPSALANRLVHLDFETDLDDWVSWAVRNEIPTEVVAFLRFRPNLLHEFDPKRSEKAFPSPRSWEFASNIFSARPDPEIAYGLFAGTVGEGAAAELLGFMRVFRDLPEPEAVLNAPDTHDIPEDPATLYALCEVLAGKASARNMENIVRFAMRLPPEFSVLLIRDAVKNDEKLVDTPAFNKWAAVHSDVLI